jgi:histidinol-phosphate/aromatic aminotransferase/cobyric acid decarboxylase-like protein
MKVALALVGAAIGFLAFRPGPQKQTTSPELSRALEYRGLITRVARQLAMDRTHVSRVAHGQRKSRKVLQALLAEVQRLERRAA